MKLDLYIEYSKNHDININNNKITIAFYKPTPFEILTTINKLQNHLKIYTKIDQINVTFDKQFQTKLIQKIITKLDNAFYSFHENAMKINYTNIDKNTQFLVKQLKNYKDIVMETIKTPETHLKYIKDNIPKGYKIKIRKIKDDDKYFPLTSSVGRGSQYNSYFIHIYKKKENKNGKNIVLIGKSITFDSGGLNLKMSHMELMKTDMTGSAIVLNVLNLLVSTNNDKNNIHLLIPIAENMIGPNATRPGTVVKSLNSISVEITNTDAEGRLCLADALSYYTKYMKPRMKTSLVLDIATLTGNVCRITAVGGVIMSNTKGTRIAHKLMDIGSSIGEYLDYIQMRDEYKPYLSSTVADLNNHNPACTAGTAFAGMFLSSFIDQDTPYVHIDLGCGTFDNNIINSFGLLLLYKLLKC